MKQLTFLLLLFSLLSTSLNGQLLTYDIFANARVFIIDQQNLEGQNERKVSDAYGLTALAYINDELHHFEVDVAAVPENGINASVGIYPNLMFFFHDLHPVFRDKRKNVRLLCGAGLHYDPFIGSSDFFVDPRFSIGSELFGVAFSIEAGIKINAVESSTFGSIPNKYIKVSVDMF